MYSRVYEAVGDPRHAPPPESYDAGWFSPQMYPKYYGGFHYRTLQNYGYPTGDIGIRGMAW
jgi:hypothetical protein